MGVPATAPPACGGEGHRPLRDAARAPPQVDWGVFKKPGRPRVQGFVFTLGWSRASYLDFAATQALAAFLRCHEGTFHYLGGIPEEILYDRTKTVWLRDDERGDPVFHPGRLDFAQHYGFLPRLCRPRRGQTKGKVEKGVGYAKKNFWPRVVDYDGADDLTGRARHWLEHTANVRQTWGDPASALTKVLA